MAQLNIRLDSIKSGVIKKELFGTFIEYIQKRVNGKFGITAQEIEDRGFDCEEKGMDWELYQYWFLYNTCSPDSVQTDKPWYYGFNKRGLRHYRIFKYAKNGEAGFYQDIILDSGKTYDFYIHIQGNTQGPLYMKLISLKDSSIIFSQALGSVPPSWEKRETIIPSLPKQTKVKLVLYIKEPGEINFDEASLMATDNRYTLRKEVYDMIKELKSGVIRFPGGCYADYRTWHFEQSIGDNDQRVSPNYWFTSLIMRMDFSLDEYMAMCEELNITPYLTVNFQSGSVQEALNLLEYCNGSVDTKYGKMRADNGHPAPYNVKYFEIGNEQWECFSPNYPTQYLDFYKAMKEYDPSIKILVNGFHWAGLSEIIRVFSVVQDNADFYSWHPAASAYPEDSILPTDEYYGMVCYSNYTQNDINIIMNGLKQYAGDNVHQAPTEWWTQYENLNTYLADTAFRAHSLEAGLADMNFMHTWIRNYSTTLLACRTFFLGFYCEDSTKTGDRVYFGTPGFYALKMMNNHHGEDFVPVDYDGIRVSSQPNTKMVYFENMPMLDAVPTKSKDTLYIAVINRDISDSVQTKFDFANYKFASRVKLYELYSDNPLDFNSAAEPKKIIDKEKKLNLLIHINFHHIRIQF
jgi:alpha-N-arabinofuranosidase